MHVCVCRNTDRDRSGAHLVSAKGSSDDRFPGTIGHRALHRKIVTQLSLLVVLGEVVRGPVEGRLPRVGQRLAELGLEVFAGFRFG